MRIVEFKTPENVARGSVTAAVHLDRGGLLVYPTETVYGLGCALADEPIDALARLKGGRAGKSFLVLIANTDQMPGLHWTAAARSLAQAFWPGPLTLSLAIESGSFPQHVASATGTVAVRISPHPGVQQLLHRYGQPITSTSANLPGHPPARTATDVLEMLTNAPAADSFLILDGGELEPSPPSTLVDCSAAVPRVLRTGAISLDQLKRHVDELQS
jgi:L-threonylcarbamoyladenylate synthase